MLKLAFSTVACPDWTLDEAARFAASTGYEGLELRTLGGGSTTLSCDPGLSDANKVRDILETHGIAAACLSTSSALHHRDESRYRHSRKMILQDLEYAKAINAGAVRIFGYEVQPGENRRSVIDRIASRTRELADRAGELGIQLLFENAGSYAVAKEWWWILNQLQHPMTGLMWNIANSVAASPEDVGGDIAVPMLNSRIRIMKLKDTVVGEGSGFVPLGDGDVNVSRVIRRLLGIGFQGWLTVEWDKAWLPGLTPPEEYLPDAKQRLEAIFEEIELASLSPKELKAREAAKKKAEEEKDAQDEEAKEQATADA